MKKLYLTGMLCALVGCIIVFIENTIISTTVSFFGSRSTFTAVFPLMALGCIGMGTCITLYVQEIIKEKELQETSSFDL